MDVTWRHSDETLEEGVEEPPEEVAPAPEEGVEGPPEEDAPEESFEQYVAALRQLAVRCDFGNITPDQILRDRIMFGITDHKVRDRLLREKNITLDRTLEICRANEAAAISTRYCTRFLKLQ